MYVSDNQVYACFISDGVSDNIQCGDYLYRRVYRKEWTIG